MTDGTYFPELRELIGRAKKSLDVIMYYCDYEPGRVTLVNGILGAIADLVPKVRVRVILERSSRFSPHISEANRRAAAFLREHGINDVFFDLPEKFSHAKVAVRDGEEVLLGSTNWFQKDFDLSHQVNVRISKPEVAKFFQDYIDRKIRDEGSIGASGTFDDGSGNH